MDTDTQTPARPDGFVQSFERGLAVIRSFSRERPSLTLSEVARETGLTRAAARRFLITLETLGYVTTDGRTFSLTPRVLDLGYAFLSSSPLADVLQRHLETLANEVHESCSASQLQGQDIVYIARASTSRIMTLGLSVGAHLPAYCTSMGRVLLAGLPEAELEEYMATVDMHRRTEHTVVSKDILRKKIEMARESGYSMLDGELEAGVRSIAVPIHSGDGAVMAAINISVHATRVSAHELERNMLPKLRETQAAIEADIRHIR